MPTDQFSFADVRTWRGEFKGDAAVAALQIVTVTRGLAVLERTFGDEAQLRKIAKDPVEMVLERAK